MNFSNFQLILITPNSFLDFIFTFIQLYLGIKVFLVEIFTINFNFLLESYFNFVINL